MPILEPDARACKEAIERLSRTRAEHAANRELDRAFTHITSVGYPSCLDKK